MLPDGYSSEERLVEWRQCSSSRRLLISLNEAGVDLTPVVQALRKRIARGIGRGAETPYEIVAAFVVALGDSGEAIVCDEILALHPFPPQVRGSLVGRSRPSASPRKVPSRVLLARRPGSPET